MRFPKFALWLCATLLLVALTTADEAASPAAEETAAEPVPEDAAVPEQTPVEEEEIEPQEAVEEPVVDSSVPEPQDSPVPQPVVEEEIVDSSVPEPRDGPVPKAAAEDTPNDGATEEDTEATLDDDELPTEEEMEEAEGESESRQEVVEPEIVPVVSVPVGDLEPVEAVEAEGSDRMEDEAETEAVEKLAVGEGDEGAEDVEEEVVEEEEVATKAAVEAVEAEGPIDTATELSPDEGKEDSEVEEEEEEEEEAASQTVASVEDEETESEVTEQTKSEDAAVVATETEAPVIAPEGATDETTEAGLKVDAIVAASNETEVAEKETTEAPVEAEDAGTSPPEAEAEAEAPPVAVTSEAAENTTSDVVTSPATLPEVAVETGSGAVAKENATTVTVVVTEANATENATKVEPTKMEVEEEEEEESVEVVELELYDLTVEQQDNIVTMELNSGSTDLNDAYYLAVTQAISDQLAPLKGVLTYVAPSLQGGEGWIQLCMVMKVGADDAVSQQELLTGIENVNLTTFGLSVLNIYPGMPTYGLKMMEYKDLSKEQQGGVVTLEMDYKGALLNDDFFKSFIVTFAEHYPADVTPEGSLVFVAPTPVVSMGLLQVILVSEIGEEGAVPVKDFVQTLKKLNLDEAGLTIISVKEGMPPTGIQVVELRELSVEQQEGIVTVEFDRGANTALQNEYAIAVAVREMNGMLQNEGLQGNIVFIAPTPVNEEGMLQAAFIMRPAKDQAVPQEKLLEAVRKMDLTKIGVTVAKSYIGMPTYDLPVFDYKELQENQRAGIVTIDVDTADHMLNTKFFKHVQKAASERISASLENVTNGVLTFVKPTPVVVAGLVQMSVMFNRAPDSEDADIVPAAELVEAMQKLNLSKCEVYLRKIRVGLPAHDLVVARSDLSEEQQNNIVTMVLDLSDDEFRASDLHVLTRLLAEEGAKGDVVLVSPTPVDEDNKLKVSIVLKNGEEGAVDQQVLLDAINKVHFDVLATSLFEAYPGMTRPTTMPPPVFPQIELEDITGQQKDSVVTVEFEVKQGNVNDESLRAAHEAFSALLVAELNRMAREKHAVPDVDPEASKRRRRETNEEDVFKAEDVSYVTPTPRVQDGKLQFVTVVDDGQGNVASQADVLAAIENLNNTGQLPPNLGLVTLYGGMPADMEATVAPPAARTAANGVTMWNSHMGLFLAIIILATICFIILIIGFMCIKYRSRRGSWSRKDDEAPIDGVPCGRKYPLVIENPIPDSEIMKGEAPMTESANPAMSYPVSKKDEDNGWVVPLDQLSPAERQKPDTENTKL